MIISLDDKISVILFSVKLMQKNKNREVCFGRFVFATAAEGAVPEELEITRPIVPRRENVLKSRNFLSSMCCLKRTIVDPFTGFLFL